MFLSEPAETILVPSYPQSLLAYMEKEEEVAKNHEGQARPMGYIVFLPWQSHSQTRVVCARMHVGLGSGHSGRFRRCGLCCPNWQRPRNQGH